MDGIFIDCPEQHKYFYPTIEGESCMKISEKGTEEWDKAICIAEKFRDVFQYSEEISYSIDKKYRKSYYEYMHKIQNTKIYKIANALNPIEYEKTTPIGSLQKAK